jgi:hypothetical protein
MEKLLFQEMRKVIFTLIKEHPRIPWEHTIYEEPLHYRPGKEHCT